MNFNLPDIQTLRNNIDFCSIAQFFHTFAPAFGPWPSTAQDIIYARPIDPNNEYVFETEDLERMLLETSERIRLEDLFVRMLRLVTRNRFINSSNWQTYYSKEFDKREYDQINPLIKQEEEEPVDQQLPQEGVVSDVKKPETVNYFTLDLDTRVHLLHLLCEWQLDEPEKLREHLNTEEDAVQWRVDPIGFDKKGSTFWLFDDNRLYKETPKPKPVKKSNARNKKQKKRVAPAPAPPTRGSRRSTRSSAVQDEPEPVKEAQLEAEESEDEGEWMPWKLLCYTKHEWENFPAKYANSKNIDEQRFYRLLVDDLLPKVLPVLEEHEEKIRKQEAMIHRKRSSRIMIKELEALERGSAEPVLQDPYSTGAAAGAAAAGGGHGRNRSNRLEQRALEKEQQEKEALAKAREERLLERERRIMEREYRALKRQASEDVVPEQAPVENGPIVIDGTTPLPSKKPKKASKKSAAKTATGGDAEQKPKRKYVKKPKFDENGNPIPRKVKLDKDGNPIPLKKRGRKPKNRDEDHWLFDCVCGVSGENIDDGTPLVACEKCGTWQHIACLQKSGQIASSDSMDNLKFVCQKCERHQEEEERERKRQREQYYSAIASPPVPGAYIPQMPTLQSSWQPQQQQHQQPSPARPSPPMPVAQQPQQHAPPQPYRPPTTSVLPPIRSHPPNQTQYFQPSTQPALHQIQQRPVMPTHYQPPQPAQQSQYPPIAMNPPSQQPLLSSAQTYPQATVSQQQTIQSIVSQVASNPVSLAQLANLLDKNLQQQQQQQQQPQQQQQQQQPQQEQKRPE